MKMNVFKLFGLFSIFIFNWGCQGPSLSEQEANRRDQAGLEAEEQTKADQNQQNQKSQQLERDLRRQYRFYASLIHDYSGQIRIKSTDKKEMEIAVNFSFQPTIPLYTGDRIRTLEEVQSDLERLAFQSSFRFWNPKKSEVSTGCLFSSAKAFHESGWVRFQNTSECPNVFQVFILPRILSDKEIKDLDFNSVENGASFLAQKILAAEINDVKAIFIRMQMVQNGEILNFQLTQK